MDQPTRSQSSAKATPQARPAAARPASPTAAPQARPAPSVEPATHAGPPPEGLAISPEPSPDNDPSIGVDWERVMVGANRSLAFTVSSSAGHDLIVTVEQSTYQRSLQGAGIVKLAVIPPASAGTPGRLMARDAVTGATAAVNWQWQPGTGAIPAGPAPARTGLLSRLFTGRSQRAAAPAARAVTRTETAARRAKRLGSRAAAAVALKFFGHDAVGQRFAFILDVSGSMHGTRWKACTSELARALDAMPDGVDFLVILFSSWVYEPPGQSGWTPAERGQIERTVAWLNGLSPGGGTSPRLAFTRVFSLADVPDVIYFLTDGEIEGFTPFECAALRGSAPTIVNTISLESQASVATLEAIAADSGGQYIHVPAVTP